METRIDGITGDIDISHRRKSWVKVKDHPPTLRIRASVTSVLSTVENEIGQVRRSMQWHNYHIKFHESLTAIPVSLYACGPHKR
jgi:hypothetical protein